MKKLISMISALALCAGMMIPVTSGAVALFINNEDKYIVNESTEYFGYTFYSKITENNELQGLYKFEYASDGHVSASPVEIQYHRFYVDIDEYDSFVEYMNSEFPEYELQTYYNYAGHDYYEVKIKNYDFALSDEEKFEIAKKIKDDTGESFICYILQSSTTGTYQYCGDLNSDNAITASDAAMVLSYYAQGQTSTATASAEGEADYSLIADYNNDGTVTAVDAALILADYAEGQVN